MRNVNVSDNVCKNQKSYHHIATYLTYTVLNFTVATTDHNLNFSKIGCMDFGVIYPVSLMYMIGILVKFCYPLFGSSVV